MIHTKIDVHERLVIHTADGELTMDMFLSAVQELYARPEFESDFGIVWDLRNCEIAITLQEILYLDPNIVSIDYWSEESGDVAQRNAASSVVNVRQVIDQSCSA